MKKKSLVAVGLISGLLLAGCGTNTTQAPVKTDSQVTENSKVEKSETYLDLKEAADAFQKQWPDGTLTQVQFDKEVQRSVYKVSGYNTEGELELTMDAVSGEVIRSDVDKEKDDDMEERKAIDVSDVIKPEDVTAKAVKESKLAKGVAEDWSLEWETGQLVYDVDVKEGTKDISVILDAKTGDLLTLED